MTKWKRQPQEVDGDCQFDGELYMTAGVAEAVPLAEIMEIMADIRQAVEYELGLDYIQVYENEEGIRLWVVDQLDQTLAESGLFSDHDYHCMILFPEEY